MSQHGGLDYRKPSLRLTCVLVVAVVATCVLFEAGWFSAGDLRPLWAREVRYQISVIADPGTNYTFFVPAIVAPNGTAAIVAGARPFVEGDIRGWQVVASEHGPMLSIAARGGFRLEFAVTPPPGVSEPATYNEQFPGGNVDLLASPRSGFPGDEESLGVVWVSADPPLFSPVFEIGLSLSYPGACGYHSAEHEGNGLTGWHPAALETQEGCPVP